MIRGKTRQHNKGKTQQQNKGKTQIDSTNWRHDN